MSPSARKNMSCVWTRMAGTSEATKYSLSPRPITTGGPERAATILCGSRARDHRQRKHAGQFLDGGAHRLFQVALEVLLHQVRDDFGVGLGLEHVAFVLQLLLQREVVFDDAVVHHDDVALAIAVRMGVLLGGTAVGGPARVADAEGRRPRGSSGWLLPGCAACPGRGGRRVARRRSRPRAPRNRSRDIRAASGLPE